MSSSQRSVTGDRVTSSLTTTSKLTISVYLVRVSASVVDDSDDNDANTMMTVIAEVL